MEEILGETEHMLARGRMGLPLSLCFAAERGDDLLLEQLLKRGSDPNEQDNNGRTALVCIPPSPFIYKTCIYLLFIYMFNIVNVVCMQQHIAAANGSEHCVTVLLENGVNPNIRGIINL